MAKCEEKGARNYAKGGERMRGKEGKKRKVRNAMLVCFE
jgi:hypothetical protein